MRTHAVSEPKRTPPTGRAASTTGGQPLDAGVRAAMEGCFGHDFSMVRVHTDPAAADSAYIRGAKAYTVGADIVFAPGRYTPHTPAGRRLLVHELTHVVQQRQSHLGMAGGDAELEAARAADAAVSGRGVRVALGGRGIQCDGEDRQIREERRASLRQRIAAIDADLTGASGTQLTDAQADERKILRAQLSYELAQLQPATPEQARAILDPGAAQRRKQNDYVNFVNLPKGLQQDLIQMGVQAPEKPVFWLGGTLPSPDLQAHVERVARTADVEQISLQAAARKVQAQPAKPKSKPKTNTATTPLTPHQETNQLLIAGGLRPLPDPDRTLTDWERNVLGPAKAAGRSEWRAVQHPETGDIVGYERQSGSFYQRRNTRGEITHQREAPMTEDSAFLTKPDRAQTPFERQRVFAPHDADHDVNRPRYIPVYNKSTGDIVGYTAKSGGITKTINTEGVVVDESELGVEPSAVQADDLLGLAALGKAGIKYGLRKGAGYLLREGGKEAVELGEKRLIGGAVEEVGEAGLKRATASEAGTVVLDEAGQMGRAAPSFSPAPADVGDRAFKARMSRFVEEVMRRNRRNTIGAGGEAASAVTAGETSLDLNLIQSNFPQVDAISRDTVASVKTWGVSKPPWGVDVEADARLVGRYDRELRALRAPLQPGATNKLSKAADLLADNRSALQASGAWPGGLAKDASAEQVAKFVNKRGVLAIPSDQVEHVRQAIATKARLNPGAYGLTPGPGLEKGIERLTSRVQSLGLSSEEIMAINRRVWGNP